MELHEKLQELRKQKGLTQEELAEILFVSRTAISKWESGRGYPSIDSLKTISKFFSVSIDELLSGDELLTIAEAETKEQQTQFRDLVLGLLDCGMILLLFLPLFGKQADGMVQAYSLLSLTGIAPYLQFGYLGAVIGTILFGILTLALQNCHVGFWLRWKHPISLLLSTVGVLLFIISRQPYAAIYSLFFLITKFLLLNKTVMTRKVSPM